MSNHREYHSLTWHRLCRLRINRFYVHVLISDRTQTFHMNIQSPVPNVNLPWLKSKVCVQHNHRSVVYLIKILAFSNSIKIKNTFVNRANLHNHSFHDKKILAKIEKKAVYSAIDEVEGYKDLPLEGQANILSLEEFGDEKSNSSPKEWLHECCISYYFNIRIDYIVFGGFIWITAFVSLFFLDHRGESSDDESRPRCVKRERKTVSDFYLLKTPPGPSIAPGATDMLYKYDYREQVE